MACALPTSVRAQSVEDGREAYLSAEFERAGEIFEGVLRDEAATPADLAEAHRYLAALRIMLGQAEPGARHATMAVALDPEATPPQGVPPEVEQAFTEAAEVLAGQRARLSVASGDILVAGDRATITAQLEPTSLPYVDAIHIECAAGTSTSEERGPPPTVITSLALEGELARCTARALNEGGASLVSSEWEGQIQGGPEEGGGDDGVVIGAVAGSVGGALVIAGVIILAVVLSSDGGDQATVGVPTVIGW